jgi:hypothetical protein
LAEGAGGEALRTNRPEKGHREAERRRQGVSAIPFALSQNYGPGNCGATVEKAFSERGPPQVRLRWLLS